MQQISLEYILTRFNQALDQACINDNSHTLQEFYNEFKSLVVNLGFEVNLESLCNHFNSILKYRHEKNNDRLTGVKDDYWPFYGEAPRIFPHNLQ